jgi:hypothetical protein
VRIAEMARSEDMMIYRYEDGFFDRFETVGEIADALDIKLNKAAQMRIYHALTRESVRKKIAGMKRKGTFGKKPNADSFDSATHWHPGHVGDGLIGKYESVLTVAQQRKVLAATRDYCQQFGYLPRKR